MDRLLAARYGQPTMCYGPLIDRGGAAQPRRHSCARSRSLQSHSPLCLCPLSERALTVPGAPNTVTAMAELTAVSIRMSNVRPHVQETADFASAIHSQRMPPNLEGAIAPPVRQSRVPSDWLGFASVGASIENVRNTRRGLPFKARTIRLSRRVA